MGAHKKVLTALYAGLINGAAAFALGQGAGAGFFQSFADYGCTLSYGALVAEAIKPSDYAGSTKDQGYEKALVAGAVGAAIMALSGEGAALGLDTSTVLNVGTGALAYYAACMIADPPQ